MVEFRVGRLADVLYVQFHAHVISDVKTKISSRRRKRYFTTTEMVVGLQSEKDLEDERRRRASVLSLLSSENILERVIF